MIINRKIIQSNLNRESSPQTRRARRARALHWRPGTQPAARPKAAFLTVTLAALAFLCAPPKVGYSASVSLSAATLNFGSVSVGTPSAPQTVVLTNNSETTLRIANLALSGPNARDFATANYCGNSVAPAGRCNISVTFTPGGIGWRTAVLTILESNGSQLLFLMGQGAAGPSIELSSDVLSFGSQSLGTASAPQTLSVRNVGEGVLKIASVSITGANAGNFTLSNGCGSPMATGTGCTLSITFRPSADGVRTATIAISDNSAGSPQTVSLVGTGVGSQGGSTTGTGSGTGTKTGTGIGNPALSSGASLSPGDISFGSQPIDTTSAAQTITLTNGSHTALSIISVGISGSNAGDFAEIADTCGSSVAPGSTCTIAVNFSPSAAGQSSAALNITDNGGNSPQVASLTGTGIHDVILTWGASPTSGISGYNIYRGTSPGGESSTPLNSAPVNSNTYVDENVTPGTSYYYVLKTVNSEGGESAPSNEANAQVPTS
jgi:hypothetical protein